MPDTVIASIRDPINDSGLFDSAFYMAKYGRIIDGSDPLDHYLRYGTRHRLDPNLYFDAEFYAQQYGQDIGEANLLWHYITIGERAGCQPSSYFSTDWYAAHLSPAEAQGGILAHYLTVGWKLRVSPHPLFDIPHYRRQLPRTGAPRRDYFADYLREGFRAGLSPHPLFHPGHYWQQVGEGMTIAPLVHYLTWGWIEDLSPHPLFDPVHYRLTARTLGEECPLVHYLVSEEPGDEPHYLFSDSFYLAQTPLVRTKRGRLYDANRVPLVHYVRRQDPVKAATHPLFDPDFYAADCRRLDIEDFTDRVPLIDYVQQGWRLGARPHRIFDVEFYLGQVGAIDMDPVRHYLTCEGFRAASPNPGLDQDFYTRESMDFDLSAPPIVHFLKTPTEQRGRPHAFFDPIYYKQKYKDITDANLCPSLHFLTFGLYEGRFPNRWFSPEYV